MYLSDFDMQELGMEQHGYFICIDGKPMYKIVEAPPLKAGYNVREITEIELKAWKRGEYKK